MSFFSSLGNALKSKTVWAGIGTTALGIGQIAAQYSPQIQALIPAGTPASAAVTIGLGILTVYGRIQAKQPLGPVIEQTIVQSVDAVNALHTANSNPAAPVSLSRQHAQLAAVKALVKGAR